ncbi:hypothetical protein Lfu02_62480 [Longispora fulva]|uniref:Transcriptional regulator with XRE-family HTH domain n=1 Tax=Longispora fulva TaxID=619741 RepID=A0A8J7GN02_9ACTN|nr:hypothetical protein [Longispora fulva]MBG6134668.1 transcriptional regulator with XRE-family HTH domain [Longispora fulva]GIG61876.1 hypothetical protein Lfu02_62480 [Longispora fulva]
MTDDKPVGNPFAVALHRAIEVRGLSLERVQAKLAAAGVAVSMSTLSLWRRGLRRPERAPSLRAVTVLENVLDLPEDSLAALLGPPRPRGRFVGQPPATGFSRLHEVPHLLDEFGAETRADAINIDLVSESVHDRYEFNEHGAESRIRVRQVARAVGEVGRWLVLHQGDDPTRPMGTLHAGHGCRRGRVRADPDSGVTLVELLFDRLLRPGEVTSFDFELVFEPGGHPEHRFGRFFGRPAGLYVGEVTFHPRAVPERCHEFVQASVDAEIHVLREVELGATLTATIAVRDVAPGLYGVFWEWE